ncbi:serpin family protein [Evansella sp. AB-rgal1]|uniref:serpin family protein n=1 Tax=Evansella sp. AB-rgal1 TaxID=3242696 RepID=UPI00359D8114
MKTSIFRASLVITFIIFIFVTLAGCAGGTGQGKELIKKRDPLFSEKDVSPELSESIVDFSTNLFYELYVEDKNQMISPYSIASVLSMALAGAGGETKEELRNVLHTEHISEEVLHDSHQALIDIFMHSEPKVTTLVGNSVWTKEDVVFNEEFIQLLEEKYNAEAKQLSTAKEVNNWVKDKTAGKIESIVDEINPDTIMFLINAVYFLGEWSDPFPKEFTRDESFYPTSGEIVQVPMMYRKEHYSYEETEEYKTIRIPYGEERYFMEVLLPAEDSSVEEIMKQFKDRLLEWKSPKELQHGLLALPKFGFDTDLQLGDVLQVLGITQAFDLNLADFTGITTDTPLFISEVKHKSFVEVNETGTEAAAVTSAEMAGSAEPIDSFEMIVDRPFLFRIVDGKTDVVLFLGHVADPSK